MVVCIAKLIKNVFIDTCFFLIGFIILLSSVIYWLNYFCNIIPNVVAVFYVVGAGLMLIPLLNIYFTKKEKELLK